MQISSGCWPVFSCLSDAVLLPYPHPRGKDPFLPVISLRWHNLLSVSADVTMTSPSPLFHCQITVQGAHKAENTKSHSDNTLSGDILHLCSLEIHCSGNTKGCPTLVALQVCKENSFIEFVLGWTKKMPKKASKLKQHGRGWHERLQFYGSSSFGFIYFFMNRSSFLINLHLWVNKKKVAQIPGGNSE